LAAEAVDVFVSDHLTTPVEGVLVRIFDSLGITALTQATTDSAGKASFLLDDGVYSARFYKFQTGFRQPQIIEVTPLGPNAFDVTAEVFVPPISNDARLCRCSGFFRDPDGSVQEYLDLHFSPEFAPIVLEGAGVLPREVDTRTDDNGYVEIDLIRGACYQVTGEEIETCARRVRVPDQTSANLPDMLFAVVDRVVLDPPGPYTLAVNAELVVTPTVYDSAGAELPGTANGDVQWSIADRASASLTIGETTLTIRGVASGTTELRASRQNLSIVRIPNADIVGQPVALTVS
jgi:hypothetical protein